MSSFENPYWNPVDVLTWVMYRDPNLLIDDFELDYILPKNRGIEAIMSPGQAHKVLLLNLNKGLLTSWGAKTFRGSQEKIPPVEWTQLKIQFGFALRGHGRISPPSAVSKHSLLGPKWSNLVVERSGILREWPEIAPKGSSATDKKSVPESLTSKPITTRRLEVLREWLDSNKISRSAPLEMTREELWDKLSGIDGKAFSIKSPHTINGFFKSQDYCKFKLGRRKEG